MKISPFPGSAKAVSEAYLAGLKVGISIGSNAENRAWEAPYLVNSKEAAEILGLGKTSFQDLVSRSIDAGTIEEIRVDIFPDTPRYSRLQLFLLAQGCINLFPNNLIDNDRGGLCR